MTSLTRIFHWTTRIVLVTAILAFGVGVFAQNLTVEGNLTAGTPTSAHQLNGQLAVNGTVAADALAFADGTVQLSAAPTPGEYTAGSQIQATWPDVEASASNSWSTHSSFRLPKGGSIRVSFQHMRHDLYPHSEYLSHARILRNGSEVAIFSHNAPSYVTRSADIVVAAGDLIKIQHRCTRFGAYACTYASSRKTKSHLRFAAIRAAEISPDLVVYPGDYAD